MNRRFETISCSGLFPDRFSPVKRLVPIKLANSSVALVLILLAYLHFCRLATSRASPNDLPSGSCSPANEAEVRRLPHANAGSDLVPQFVTSRDVFLEFKAFVTLTAR
jgi:hypothetical protein